MTSDIFHRTDFMAINLEVCLNHLQKRHFHCLARDIRQVIHLILANILQSVQKCLSIIISVFRREFVRR